jgi:hypothetical protein
MTEDDDPFETYVKPAESVLENRRVQAPRVGRISAIMSRPGCPWLTLQSRPGRRLLARLLLDLVKTHVFTPRGRRTDWADLPEHKSGFFMRTPGLVPGTGGDGRPGLRHAGR